MSHSPRHVRQLFLLACLLLASCFSVRPWIEQSKPWTKDTLAGAERVRIQRADGSSMTMVDAAIAQTPNGPRITGRSIPAEGQVAIAFDVALADVTRLETSRLEGGRVMANVAIWTFVVVTVLMAMVVATSTGAMIGGF